MADSPQFSASKIVSATRGVSVKLGDILEYETSYGIGDLPDNGLVTKSILLNSAGKISDLVISLPSGSAIPFTVDMTNPIYANVDPFFIPQVEILLDGNFATATKTRTIFDIGVEKDFVDDTREILSSLKIYGHASIGDPAITIDEIIIIIK